jgi:hypothetical protein
LNPGCEIFSLLDGKLAKWPRTSMCSQKRKKIY